MKRNFQILFILLFVLTGIISPVRGKNKTGDCNIRFCTYNIRGDLPNDGINSWKFRKDSLCKIINNHDFDIVCMQEVLANQLEDIEQATGYAFVGIRGLYNPIFYKAERFELLHNEMFWLLSQKDGTESTTVTALGPNSAIAKAEEYSMFSTPILTTKDV